MTDIKSPNAWTLRGRLTDDPRSNARKKGEGNITNFRLAVNQPVIMNGEVDSRENYFNVSVFDAAQADIAAAFGKGDRVEVVGLAVQRKSEWTKDGEEHHRWNLECHVSEGFGDFKVVLLDKAGAKEPA